MDNTAVAKDLDQELFSELTEPLVQPLLVHIVAPFVNGDDKNFSVQMNGKLLWEWRKLDGNLKKLFAVLQANLHVIGYTLEESAFDRVANLLNINTKRFLNKLKEQQNGKRRERKKGETWIKMALHPDEIAQTPYDIVKEMSLKENELRQKNAKLQCTLEEQAQQMYETLVEASADRHRGRNFRDVGDKQQQRHLSQIQ